MAPSITADHDATEVAKGTVVRFHGSSVSGMTVKIWSPGLFRNQPMAKLVRRMGERLEVSPARQASATPVPRTTAPGRTFIRRTSRPIVSRRSPQHNSQPDIGHQAAPLLDRHSPGAGVRAQHVVPSSVGIPA
jgi:hypothetical protein